MPILTNNYWSILINKLWFWFYSPRFHSPFFWNFFRRLGWGVQKEGLVINKVNLYTNHICYLNCSAVWIQSLISSSQQRLDSYYYKIILEHLEEYVHFKIGYGIEYQKVFRFLCKHFKRRKIYGSIGIEHFLVIYCLKLRFWRFFFFFFFKTFY